MERVAAQDVGPLAIAGMWPDRTFDGPGWQAAGNGKPIWRDTRLAVPPASRDGLVDPGTLRRRTILDHNAKRAGGWNRRSGRHYLRILQKLLADR